MSTQLLEPQTPVDEVTAETTATAAPRETPGEPTFDRPTRLRLQVGEELADTLEALAESGTWDRLDPAVAAHLIAQAERLCEHVARLQDERPVKKCEAVALRLRRLERRLSVSVEHLDETAEKRKRGAGLFLGDFTEPEKDEPSRKAATTDKDAAGKPKRKVVTAAADAVRGIRTRAERVATKAMHKRVTMYVVTGVLLAFTAIALNFKESIQEKQVVTRPPNLGIQPNAFFDDMKAFMPVVQTSQRDRQLFVVVSKDWLLRTAAQRTTDAEAAYVYVSNRNVPKMIIAFDDGIIVVKFDNGVATWFDASKMPKDHAVAHH